jgi:monoamine oxidase
MANLWRSLKILEKEMALGASERVEGGSARLTDAMAASLPKGTLRLNMPVTELHDRGNHVECISGGKSFTAPFAVCTLPFTVLRSEKMRLSFPKESEAVALQRNAISSLPYTRIVQVHVVPKEPFWEKDGLPTEMWTDGPIERVFTNFDDQGGVKSLTCWINGDGARLDLSQSSWQQLVESEFARIRQTSIEIAKIVRWDETNPYAGGAYMHWAPGQIAQWAGKMGATSGRLYFAGEHVSFLHTGMEGAMESAEIAVVGLLEAADR